MPKKVTRRQSLFIDSIYASSHNFPCFSDNSSKIGVYTSFTLRFNPLKNPSTERNGEIMKKFIAIGSILVVLLITLTGVSFAEGRNSPGLFNEMGAHQKMYMLLLSEKFTPELTRDWETELNRRDAFRGEIIQLHNNKEPVYQILDNLEEIKNRLKVLEEKIDKSKRQTGPDMDGEKMHPEREKPKFRKGPGFPQQRFFFFFNQFFFKNQGAAMEKNRELFKKFTEAVDIGDEVQIKSILPLLFQQLKESNQQLEEHLEILKNRNEE